MIWTTEDFAGSVFCCEKGFQMGGFKWKNLFFHVDGEKHRISKAHWFQQSKLNQNCISLRFFPASSGISQRVWFWASWFTILRDCEILICLALDYPRVVNHRSEPTNQTIHCSHHKFRSCHWFNLHREMRLIDKPGLQRLLRSVVTWKHCEGDKKLARATGVFLRAIRF